MNEHSAEWICRNIFEKTPDGVVFADSDGVIRFWNSGAEIIFGFSANEAVGRDLDIIIPEKLRERHRQGYSRAMETGVSKYMRELLAVPAIRKDGARISIEFSIAVLKSAQGAIVGTGAIIRDVTSRWEREKALKGALKSGATTV